MLHRPIEQRLARFATAPLLRPLANANTNTGGGSSVVATVLGYYCSSISTRFASSSSLVPPQRLPAAPAAGPCRCALSLSPGTPPSTTASSGTPRCSSLIGAAPPPPPRWGSSRPGAPKTTGFGTPRCSSSSTVGAAAATQQGSFWRAINRGGGAIAEGEERRGAGRRKPRVVIIGAGMAGIAAAQQLQNVAGAGMCDLTVLEASDRIGGRIWSSEFNGEGIELGATWIHGIEGSPLYKTAVQIGAMQNSERAWEGKDGFLQFNNAVVKAEGGLAVASELVEPVVEAYKQLLQEAQEMEVVQPKEMVAGAVAIDTAPGKMSDLLCSCSSVGDFLRQGLDRFLAQQQQESTHHQGSRISALAEEEDPAEGTCGSPRWTTKSLQEGCFKLHENLERMITSADDLYDIDLVDYNEYLEFPGEHKTVGKGYSSVVHALASCLPPGVVQFGQKVEKIVWSDSCRYSEAPVNIHCHGGSVVEADHVIITVSLGVLKARTLASLETNMNAGNTAFPSRMLAAAEFDSKMNSSMSGESSEDGDDKKAAESPTAADELFDPPLPMWKLDSISKLGFGVVDKVFVQNEPPAEGGEHQAVQFIFHPRGEEAGEQQQHHSSVPEWIRKTFSLYPIHRKSHALVAWFVGREALQVESLSDDEILSGISKTLASFGIPENEQGTFLGVRRSQWGQNPLFRGSYSYVKVGSTGDDIDTLAEPLPKLVGDGGAAPLQVLFAGEATHRHYYSTTHGAYFSGLREAERLLQHYGLLGQR